MKTKIFIYLLLITASVFIISCNNDITGDKTEPVSVILDTDVGNDIDDVMAINMLLNYQKKNIVNILGITISKSNPYVIEYVDGFCRYNNCPDIPIGYAYNGVNNNDGTYVRQTLDTLINGGHVLNPEQFFKDGLPEAHILQRKLLADQADNSVIFIVVGPETNIARLLNTPPDEISPLSGIDLVAKKVKLLSIMGGLYTDKFDFPEWNIVNDLDPAKTLFEKWPTPIVASGWEVGNDLKYPHQSILNDFPNSETNPLCVSYKFYQPMPYDRPTWDLTSVLYAIEPDSNYFKLSPRGTIKIDSIGKSTLEPSENGKHRFLIIDADNHDRTLEALVNRVVGLK